PYSSAYCHYSSRFLMHVSPGAAAALEDAVCAVDWEEFVERPMEPRLSRIRLERAAGIPTPTSARAANLPE
ncbi:hypothetical protein PFISCL1PPCAC_2980, partial [Pristionchus fissidentatus]